MKFELVVSSFLVTFSIILQLVHANLVPAMFIFGDSLVDSGNNNALLTLAQANFAPYGKDFYNHVPTGRFANGNLVPDFLATKLELPLQPSYISSGEDILHGINFASAGSGILDSTGTVFGEHISLPKQVEQFSKVKSAISAKVGEDEVSKIISKSIMYISVGSNDIVNNYYLFGQVSPLSVKYTYEQFVTLLISEYQKQIQVYPHFPSSYTFITYIQSLYELGARKFILPSVTALGCSPINLLRYEAVGKGQCVEFLNKASRSYNDAVKSSVSRWTSLLPGAHIVYANTYDYVLKLVKSPSSYGYQVSDKACCSGIGKNGAIVFCLRDVPTCNDASTHVYWDEFHPSSRVYGELADKFWLGSQEDAYPINVKQLVGF